MCQNIYARFDCPHLRSPQRTLRNASRSPRCIVSPQTKTRGAVPALHCFTQNENAGFLRYAQGSMAPLRSLNALSKCEQAPALHGSTTVVLRGVFPGGRVRSP